jgi:hypothetical protein
MVLKLPIEWYPWPMEQTLSREAIECAHGILRTYLEHINDFAPLDPVETELWNCVNHIAAWLEKHPISEIDELLL